MPTPLRQAHGTEEQQAKSRPKSLDEEEMKLAGRIRDDISLLDRD